MSISRLKDYRGPALFSYGFRPFFFFGSVYAGAIILVWLPAFYGKLQLSTAFAPRDWHVHEMLFGYIAAVVAGFLLTAVPNWTGRLPLQGRPLMPAVLDLGCGPNCRQRFGVDRLGPGGGHRFVFLILLAAAAAREIIAGRKWSNLKIVAIVSLLAAGNLAFHLEAHFTGLAEYTTRGGVAMVIMLIALIGGRIIPSFTRNWLARRAPGHMPSPFGRFDAVTMAFTVFVLAAVGGSAAGPDDRRAAAGMRLHAHRSPGALDRLPDVRRPAGADPARRLCVHPGWVSSSPRLGASTSLRRAPESTPGRVGRSAP